MAKEQNIEANVGLLEPAKQPAMSAKPARCSETAGVPSSSARAVMYGTPLTRCSVEQTRGGHCTSS
jgi:hypothetical protein